MELPEKDLRTQDKALELKLRNARSVFLDFDGTLIDASRVICSSFNAALRSFSLPELRDSEILPLVGIPLVDMFVSFELPVATEELVDAYRRSFSQRSLQDTVLIDGAAELIEALRGRRLAIVTSRSTRSTEHLLTHFGLREAFSAVIGVDQVACGKPDPEPVLLALRRTGGRAEETLFVGDTPHDMIAAERAGVTAIGVSTGFHSEGQLREAGAEAVFCSLGELKEALQDGAGGGSPDKTRA